MTPRTRSWTPSPLEGLLKQALEQANFLRENNAALKQAIGSVESLSEYQGSSDVKTNTTELTLLFLREVRQLVPSQTAAVFLFDQVSHGLVLQNVVPQRATRACNAEVKAQVEAGTTNLAIGRQHAVFVSPLTPFYGLESSRTIMLVPLASTPVASGLLFIVSKQEEKRVTPDVVRLVSLAARQYALALRFFRLYEDLSRHNDALNQAKKSLQEKVVELENNSAALQRSLSQVRAKSAELERFKQDLEHKVQDRTRELEELNSRLEKMAHTDNLTGAYNRQSFEDMFARECARITRYGGTGTIMVVDINSLKVINDTLGHMRGDVIIRETARLLKDNSRTTDLVARYGGDEFVVLLPETNFEGAMRFVERFREAVEHWNQEAADPDLELKLAIGCASTSENIDLVNAFKLADDRMYRDKRSCHDMHWSPLRSRNVRGNTKDPALQN